MPPVDILQKPTKLQYCFSILLTSQLTVKMQNLSEDNFKVLIRVRPLNSKQKQQMSSYEQFHSRKMKGSTGKAVKMSPSMYSFYTKFYNCNINDIIRIQKTANTILVADQQYKNTDKKMRPFAYSGVYDGTDKNSMIFSHLEEHVSSVLEGFNCTILTYGITGSGKTYTVFGPTSKRYNSMPNSNSSSNFNTFNANTPEKEEEQCEGISYLAFEYLLRQKKKLWAEQGTKVNYKLSFIEIYNENVIDLLSNETQREQKFLNIVEDNKGNTTVSDVIEINIESIEQVYQCINMGNTKRVFAATLANQYSSRSHAILQVTVETQKSSSQKMCSKLYVIDLAGSQKLQTLNSSKKLQEGANINRSLLALGNCINTLAENSRKNVVTHIPYRDSKLTRMLKDSLGGNTKTVMIACISPNPFLIDQTVTTLNYALRAQGIKKKIIRNQQQSQKEQFVCTKCKKVSKLTQFQSASQGGRTTLRERSSSLANLPNLPISMSIEPTKRATANLPSKVTVKLEVLERLYEDIVNNIREAESIKSFTNTAVTNEPEWLKLKCVNEEQRIRLKQVLFSAFKRELEADLIRCESLENLGNELTSSKMIENKENLLSADKDQVDNKSLASSKNRRRRSHNKFEVVRKSDSMCRALQFQ